MRAEAEVLPPFELTNSAISPAEAPIRVPSAVKKTGRLVQNEVLGLDMVRHTSCSLLIRRTVSTSLIHGHAIHFSMDGRCAHRLSVGQRADHPELRAAPSAHHGLDRTQIGGAGACRCFRTEFADRWGRGAGSPAAWLCLAGAGGAG